MILGNGPVSSTPLSSQLWNTPAASVTIATGFGNLVLTGYAPTVSVTANSIVSTGLGNLVLTGYEPTVSVTANQYAAPDLGQLVLTGYAPTVTKTDNVFVNPETGALVITGYEPTVTQGGSWNVTPDLANLILTGYAPGVVNSGDVVTTGQTPAGSAKRRQEARRRRIMLPDGTLIWATFEEAYDIVNQYAKPAQDETKEVETDEQIKRMVSRETDKPLRREEVKWVPVQDVTTETYRPILPPRLTFAPTVEGYRQVLRRLQMRQDDEEAVMLLLLH